MPDPTQSLQFIKKLREGHRETKNEMEKVERGERTERGGGGGGGGEEERERERYRERKEGDPVLTIRD